MKDYNYIGVQLPQGPGLRPVNPYLLKSTPSVTTFRLGYSNFEEFANKNTFLCEGAIIGKEYDKSEVEGLIWQVRFRNEKEFKDMPMTKEEDDFAWLCIALPDHYRQIYRLKSQPKEEEPADTKQSEEWDWFGWLCARIPELKKKENEFWVRQCVEDLLSSNTKNKEQPKPEETAEEAACNYACDNVDNDHYLSHAEYVSAFNKAECAFLAGVDWQKQQEGK